MGFLSSFMGLRKHEPVVTTSPTKSKKIEHIQTVSPSLQSEPNFQPNASLETRVTTQRPTPTTPSPRAHA